MSDPTEIVRPAGPPSSPLRRVVATARNAVEVVRFGGLVTDDQRAPYKVDSQHLLHRLRHYFPADVPPDAPVIVLVPPLMLTTEVWDVSPTSSAVRALHDQGLDCWVVDFGSPDREPGGLQRTLADHVLATSDAVDDVRRATGRDVILAGYSQGGMFAYQAAALRRGANIDSLVTFGALVDSRAPLPLPLSADAVARLAAGLVESGLFRRFAVPGWFSRLVFESLTPAKSVRDRARFLLALHDRDALLPRERQRRFLQSDGWTAWSGPAVVEFLETYFQHNRMLEGGFVVDDRLVTLADLGCPILTVVGSTDTIGHPDSVRAIRFAAPRAEVYELTLRAGHFGLVVGSTAARHTWPAVAGWAKWRAGTGAMPESIRPADQVDARHPRGAGPGISALAQATDFGIGATRIALGAAARTVDAVRGIATEAPGQLPRLARIEQLQPSTRISLGSLLDEQAHSNPDEVVFLFGDRAHRHRDVKHRVDSVVRGLISGGVHAGERVGVLMRTRPSAFTVVAALSRLGATAVLLRPDGDLAREARLGAITTVVTDPEHAEAARAADVMRRLVLGAASGARGVPAGVVDLERVDPDDIVLPAWYEANPQRSGDVAFVLFTGEGVATTAVEVTNRRWALSALGTASAAALGSGDTVYSVTPIHHSSALLMSVGGAVAGGARFAIATAADPETFWTEVRRYGATHVSYTWTSLRPIVDAAPSPIEQHHPIRMVMGSGLPRNLWRRFEERFPGVRVLEFYGSLQSEAILANLSGRKQGCMGKPLPGSAEVRVGAYDLAARRLAPTVDGLAREALADEVGLLLARATAGGPGTLRDVFMAGDAWRSTGDLFLRDDRGDLWLAGSVSEIVDTSDGPVLPVGARQCLGSLPAVDLVVAYGVPDGAAQSLVGAVTLRPQSELTAAELDEAFEPLPRAQRPRWVQALPEIPLTTWCRPVWREPAALGVPVPGAGRAVWRLDDAGRYQPLAVP